MPQPPVIPAPTPPLLALRGIRREFALPGADGLWRRSKNTLVACDDVDLEIRPSEIVSLVGESGSGKSTLARIAVLLDRPGAGEVVFDGEDLLALPRSELRRRRRHFQIVFQDPLSSLNPRWRIGDSLGRPLRVHGLGDWPSLDAAVVELLDLVDLPASVRSRFPHELSGGQRQRVCIARALALRPKLLVADEAVSALDVSTQAAVLSLFETVRDAYGTAILFIAHDLRIVHHLSDRVAVMQRGRIVEMRESAALFASPEHEYTRTLIDSVLQPRYPPPQEIIDA
jgi:peptide/nickel transport system ATP-binding protein